MVKHRLHKELLNKQYKNSQEKSKIKIKTNQLVMHAVQKAEKS